MITLSIDLTDRLCVVVGGGEAAEQKVRALLRAGARVRVVSPSLSPWLEARLAGGEIEYWSRRYQPGDLEGAALGVAATGRPEADRAVAAEAKAARQLLSVSGEPGLGDVRFLAELHRGPVTIAIATDGGSPALAVRIRDEIGQVIGLEYGALAALLTEARQRLKAEGRLSQPERAQRLRQLVHGPALEMLARGEIEEARRLVERIISADGPSEGERQMSMEKKILGVAKELDRGLILVNTGDGKGKSTAAFGTAVRAHGRGLKVCIIQFIKGNWRTGEQEAMKQLGIEMFQMGYGFIKIRPSHKTEEEHFAKIQATFNFVKEKAATGEYDLIVLDEINVALKMGGITPGEVVRWLQEEKPRKLHVILTGRGAPPELIEAADLVTEMKLVKHHFQAGIGAVKGLEF